MMSFFATSEQILDRLSFLTNRARGNTSKPIVLALCLVGTGSGVYWFIRDVGLQVLGRRTSAHS